VVQTFLNIMFDLIVLAFVALGFFQCGKGCGEFDSRDGHMAMAHRCEIVGREHACLQNSSRSTTVHGEERCACITSGGAWTVYEDTYLARTKRAKQWD
jgi:hypothetical protein